jgi:hypothetical protein
MSRAFGPPEPIRVVLSSMPHGPRSDRISQRDLEVLEFIARHGLVPRDALAHWAGTSRTVTYERERRLLAAGLIVRSGFGTDLRLFAPTSLGLRACGRSDLRPPRHSPATLRHEALTARLAARLERGGERLLSEREVLARERAEGEQLLSASLSRGRIHRADLIRVNGDDTPVEAIEVELTIKGATRLDALLRAWHWAVAERRIQRVIYYCSPQTKRFVERAIERTRTAEVISTGDLDL